MIAKAGRASDDADGTKVERSAHVARRARGSLSHWRYVRKSILLAEPSAKLTYAMTVGINLQVCYRKCRSAWQAGSHVEQKTYPNDYTLHKPPSDLTVSA